VDSLQKRIEQLQDIEEKFEVLNKKNEELMGMIQDERQKALELQHQLKEEQIARQSEKERYQTEIERLHKVQVDEVERLRERLTLEKENAVQAANNEWQAKLSEVKENYAEKIESLYIQMERMREEYEKKLDDLRDKLIASTSE
jgi:hypothetical protein